MRYAAWARQFCAVQLQQGNDGLPLDYFLWANCYDALYPDSLGLDPSGMLTFRGQLAGGPTVDLPALIDAPGFGIWPLSSDSSTSYIVQSQNPPAEIMQPFTYLQVGDLIGADAQRFLSSLLDLLGNVAQLHVVPDAELSRIVEINRRGVIAMPADGQTLCNLYASTFGPGTPCSPVFPDEQAQSGACLWSQVCGQFANVRDNALGLQYATAADQAEVSAGDVGTWSSIASGARSIMSCLDNGPPGGVNNGDTGDLGGGGDALVHPATPHVNSLLLVAAIGLGALVLVRMIE